MSLLGSKISVSVMSKAGKGPSDRNLKKSRLIVRNLNFKVGAALQYFLKFDSEPTKRNMLGSTMF